MDHDDHDDDDNRHLLIFGPETLFSIQYPYPYLTVLLMRSPITTHYSSVTSAQTHYANMQDGLDNYQMVGRTNARWSLCNYQMVEQASSGQIGISGRDNV